MTKQTFIIVRVVDTLSQHRETHTFTNPITAAEFAGTYHREAGFRVRITARKPKLAREAAQP